MKKKCKVILIVIGLLFACALFWHFHIIAPNAAVTMLVLAVLVLLFLLYKHIKSW